MNTGYSGSVNLGDNWSSAYTYTHVNTPRFGDLNAVDRPGNPDHSQGVT